MINRDHVRLDADTNMVTVALSYDQLGLLIKLLDTEIAKNSKAATADPIEITTKLLLFYAHTQLGLHINYSDI